MTQRTRNPAAIVVAALALAALLAACVPGSEPGAEPEVAVMNAPVNAQVEGVADAFAARLRQLGTPGFDVVRDVALAGLENRSNLSGSRAVPNAANIARSLGSTWALMLGAVDVEREVVDSGPNEVAVVVRVAVEGVLVRGSDARVVARITSRTLSGERFAAADEELPEPLRDPLVRDLSRQAAEALAPVFREILAAQVGASEAGQRK